MKFNKKKSSYILDPKETIVYTIQSSYNGTVFPHSHDYYELFLIVNGTQYLEINSKEILLKESSLGLIRPNDVHTRRFLEEGIHINIAFPTRTANSLFRYLGEGFPKENLLNPQTPPIVVLSKLEKTFVRERFEMLNFVDVSNTESTETSLRILLFELMTKYFITIPSTKMSIPAWLKTTLDEMNKLENFVVGVPFLIKTSNMTHEHLCRSFKKFLNVTPTEYINDLRLNYIANMLIHSDTEIMSIGLDAGFDNTSHFYHLFKKKFKTTPAEYRKLYSTIIS